MYVYTEAVADPGLDIGGPSLEGGGQVRWHSRLWTEI